MKEPHVHAECICAWANGEDIEYRVPKGEWTFAKRPTWNPNREYRVKPKSISASFSVHRSGSGCLYLRRRPDGPPPNDYANQPRSFVAWVPTVTATFNEGEVSWKIQ